MRRLSQALGRRSSKAGPPSGPDQEEGDQDPDPLVAQQKKTFRRWVNSHLASRRLEVKHIINDWEDGILLTNLMEILADTNLGKINLKPKMKLHNLENLNRVLAFIEKHVKIVNIGSEDLYSHNQTIILGLIWTLILRWGVKLGDGGKTALLNWVNNKVKDLGGPPVKNFTSDWQNGMKFAALVHVIDPEFDFNSCAADQPLNNMDRAFKNAEANLNIPVLLDAADVAANPDEKSVMTYVGMFFNEFGNRDDFVVKRVKPVKPVVSNPTSNSADITFQIPEGAKAVKVVVTDVATGAVVLDRTFPKDTTETTFTANDLAEDNQFSCVAIAVQDNDKETAPSEAADFATSKVGAPSAPRITDSAETALTVEVEPVAGASSYKLLVASPASSKNFDRIVPLETGKTVGVVDGLTPGVAHAFKVVATSTGGKDTDPSAPTIGTTKLFPADQASVGDMTDNSAVVIIPVASNPVPEGTRYKVQVMDPDDAKGGWGPEQRLNQDAVVAAPLAGSAQVDIDELEPEHTYQVRLIAISPDGVESDPSSPVAFTTAAEAAKSRIALVTGGNTPAGVEIVKDLVAVDSKFGKYDIVFVCIREGGDTQSANELRDLAEQSGDVQVNLVNYDKKNSESVREAAKMLKANKIHLIVNNAKLKREQLSLLIGNQ